ncbi:DNA mismatch repair protein MutT [Clostridium botulinum]|uniref:NUDIX hydrolase n=1 Tax=Clostridium botulinum TaxID=1491 RepID=UPI000596B750|nr:NUDIX domain-containing protein [Clostridium botulinum]KIL07535.1 DNA mismatch repair protein MutT [Clostridium botulinum]MBY6935417.1 NUDIX domain-containing protein [Clostridium botulinum]NFL82162.1 NUDIX domain-containing protein [Clostridium botulinum]NFN12584.1 NUDIX domain-containing protein [Clostridium botulinum]NFO37750.1 NUDIX domain-containing protein [Clostridium botulinum]
MKKDILFKTDDFIFSYRVAGILIYNDKILLQKPLKDEGYSLIGGHVAIQETTEETLIREFKEEIHADIKIVSLFAIGEIFFTWGKKPCHQISLYYKIQLSNLESIPIDRNFKGYDEVGNKRIDMDFCWIPLEKLKEIKVYPKELISHILEDKNEVIHFISNDR